MKNILLVCNILFCGFAAVSTPVDPPANETGAKKIPAALVGKWLNGSFSMSNWWSYDGKKYIGNPYTRSVAFNFSENGDVEFYLVIKTHTGYCSTEAFTYHKGKLKVNEAEQSFTVYPESGNYRGFYSCAAGSNLTASLKRKN